MLKRKFAVFYVLITSLCFVTSAFILLHALGYRVNRSASLPFLIYKITPLTQDSEIERGDCVLIDISKLSNPVITCGIKRGYVSKAFNQPMMKQIAAIPGDTVEIRDGALFVNAEMITPITVASRDSYGGELFAWPTPITLLSSQYWLVSDPKRGFDSRYFGPVMRDVFTYKAKPLF